MIKFKSKKEEFDMINYDENNEYSIKTYYNYKATYTANKKVAFAHKSKDTAKKEAANAMPNV